MISKRRLLRLALALLSTAMPATSFAQDTNHQQTNGVAVTMDAARLFDFADAAAARGDYATAESAYRALAADPDEDLRAEARFRLAMMLHGKLGQTREAAVLLRQILDEKPDAARVRVELAQLQAALGNVRAAERELRAAQAAGLPPEVEQLVRFYANALDSLRSYGFSAELALAPDTNVNRATKSDTLGTIVGDFDLGEDAQAQSGIGFSTRGQMWGRVPVSQKVELRAELNSSADFYRQHEFDDYALGLQAGPQWRSGTDTIALMALTQWRWFGGEFYTHTYGAEGSFRHLTGKRSQLRLEATALKSDDQFNDLRDANAYSLAVGLDRAFSSQSGGGARLTGHRNVARDPGYSTATGGISAYLYKEFREATLVGTAAYSHLEADERIFLYPERRMDDRFSVGLSATLRRLKIGTFAPVVGITFERNRSSIEIYDYRRLAGKAGVTAAF